MKSFKKALLIALGSICFVLGMVGAFVPVLPTTPLLLLAAFLFSRSSDRLNAWLEATPVYQAYVVPFKQNGGISLGRKIRMIVISYAVMGVSAFFVRKWFVWAVLLAVAVFLLILMFVKIPTISKEEERSYGFDADGSKERVVCEQE